MAAETAAHWKSALEMNGAAEGDRPERRAGQRFCGRVALESADHDGLYGETNAVHGDGLAYDKRPHVGRNEQPCAWTSCGPGLQQTGRLDDPGKHTGGVLRRRSVAKLSRH
jgi:hypothetical protein